MAERPTRELIAYWRDLQARAVAGEDHGAAAYAVDVGDLLGILDAVTADITAAREALAASEAARETAEAALVELRASVKPGHELLAVRRTPACNSCEETFAEEPIEDRCPACESEGSMTTYYGDPNTKTRAWELAAGGIDDDAGEDDLFAPARILRATPTDLADSLRRRYQAEALDEAAAIRLSDLEFDTRIARDWLKGRAAELRGGAR